MPPKDEKEKLQDLMEIYKRNLETELGRKVEPKNENISIEYLKLIAIIEFISKFYS